MRQEFVSVAAAVLVVVIELVSSPSRATTITATSGGLDEITVFVNQTVRVDIVLDTEGVPTKGYAVETAWDGGPVPLLTVPNPNLDNGGSILESHPSYFTPATLGIDSYTASAPGTPGRIEEFEATASPAIGSGTIDGLIIGSIFFKTLNTQGVATVTPSFGAGDAVLDETGTGSLPTTFGALTVNVIPEPATAELLCLGLTSLALVGRRRLG